MEVCGGNRMNPQKIEVWIYTCRRFVEYLTAIGMAVLASYLILGARW